MYMIDSINCGASRVIKDIVTQQSTTYGNIGLMTKPSNSPSTMMHYNSLMVVNYIAYYEPFHGTYDALDSFRYNSIKYMDDKTHLVVVTYD